MAALEEAIKEASLNGRACPIPRRWHEMWETLPNRHRVGDGWAPALPLILGAWWHASNLQKALRFREHIEWASSHGSLDDFLILMRALPEDEWHHFGD